MHPGGLWGISHARIATSFWLKSLAAATTVTATMSLAAHMLAQSLPQPQQSDWMNWVATASFAICCALVAIIYRSIVKAQHDDRESTNKRLTALESGVRNLTEIHALLVGITPGVQGGMLEDLGHLKRRERQLTSELLELKMRIVLLEAAITTIPDTIMKLQREKADAKTEGE